MLLCVACGMAGAGVEVNGNWHEKTQTRERFCLNGEWDLHPLRGMGNDDWYAAPELGRVDDYAWKMKMRVPGTWKGGAWGGEHQFFESGDAAYLNECLCAWYRREFFVPADWADKQVKLEFGGVGYKATTYINRQSAGTHVGGFTPFEVDITEYVKPGEANELLVHNAAFRRHWERPKEGPLVAEGNFSGIWGDVYLRATSKVYIDNVFVKTSVREGTIECILEIVNKDTRDHTVSVGGTVVDGDRTALTMPEQQGTVPAGEMLKVRLVRAWKDAHRWSLEDPHLYHMQNRLTEDGQAVDDTETRFGFREFWIDGKDFRLNGEIVRMRNFPVMGQRPAEERPEYVRGWFTLMKEKLHHNCIRMQHINSGIYPDIADEVGMLIEEGTGFVGGDQHARWNWPEANKQTNAEIREWIRSRRNNPSIVIWSMNNECWSMVDVKKYRDGDKTARGIYQWLLDTGARMREHDDTRVITYHNLGDMHDWTRGYVEEFFEAGDLMGQADNYNLHYPNNYRFVAEQVEIGDYWAREKDKPLIIGEFPGPQVATPGNTSHFVIHGEGAARHGSFESDAGYYFFRRAVGGWRAAGVSGLYGWVPHFYAVRKVLGRHDFTWDDLTTPYMKPAHVRYALYNPGWDKSKPACIPDNTDPPEANNRFWDMISESFSPLLINLGGDYWEHHYLSGQTIARTASLVNDTPGPLDVQWEWVIEDGGKRLQGSTQSVKLRRAEIRKVRFDVQLPQVAERRELTLRLTASGGGLVSHDGLDLRVYPTVALEPPQFPPARIALYDKVGKTEAVLKRVGIPYRRVDEIVGKVKAGRHDLLIIGCDSADDALKWTTTVGTVPVLVKEYIRDYVKKGGNVLVFEQGRETFENLDSMFPGISTPPLEHLSPSHHASSYAGVAAPGHPVFSGIGKGISLWNGEYGRIAEFHFPRPHGASVRPLLFSDRWSAALVEGSHGKGTYLMCQVFLTGRYGSDPEATGLMHNLLSYAVLPAPAATAKAAVVGDVQGFLGAFAADTITGTLEHMDLRAYEVLFLGRDTMREASEVTGNAQTILAFAEQGGAVFVLPQRAAGFAGDWLPGQVGLRDMASQYIYKEETSEPLMWGVSDFDLARFYAYPFGLVNAWPHPKVTSELHDWSREWRSLLLVSREPPNWDMATDAQVGGVHPTGGSALLQARHGRGRIILCQLDLVANCGPFSPEALADMETRELGARRVADTFLTNLGLAVGRGE